MRPDRISQTNSLLQATDPKGPLSMLQPQWFALYTTPCHEKCVAEHLTRREIESFLPLYRTVNRWKNRRQVELERPLFPNYLFVRIEARERSRVLAVPGVLSIVGSARAPLPLPQEEIEELRAGLHLRRVEPHPYLVVGEKCRIKSGPLTGMTGVLLRKKSGFRIVLALDLIMQSVAVEVDAEEVEPLPSGATFRTAQFSTLGKGDCAQSVPTH